MKSGDTVRRALVVVQGTRTKSIGERNGKRLRKKESATEIDTLRIQ